LGVTVVDVGGGGGAVPLCSAARSCLTRIAAVDGENNTSVGGVSLSTLDPWLESGAAAETGAEPAPPTPTAVVVDGGVGTAAVDLATAGTGGGATATAAVGAAVGAAPDFVVVTVTAAGDAAVVDGRGDEDWTVVCAAGECATVTLALPPPAASAALATTRGLMCRVYVRFTADTERLRSALAVLSSSPSLSLSSLLSPRVSRQA
jgi:hypothetical protein